MKVATGYRNAVADAIQAALDYGVIYLYSGAMPASPDLAETGTNLAIITNNGGTFTPSVQDSSSLRFGEPAVGVISILAGQTWKTNACLATGVVGWGRLYANARIQGASTTAVRLDFTCGLSGADLNLVTTSVQAGLPFVISSFTITVQ